MVQRANACSLWSSGSLDMLVNNCNRSEKLNFDKFTLFFSHGIFSSPLKIIDSALVKLLQLCFSWIRCNSCIIILNETSTVETGQRDEFLICRSQ